MDARVAIMALETVGIAAAALNGILLARQKDLDVVGAYSAALATAFGGGTLRDVFLGRRPLFWIEHHEYPLALGALTVVVLLLSRRFSPDGPRFHRVIDLCDAVGLGTFSALSATYAHTEKCPLFACALLGVTGGVAGGIARDVLCNEIPRVFQRTQLYATCAFAGALVTTTLLRFEAGDTPSLLAGLVATFALRAAAIRWDLKLPL